MGRLIQLADGNFYGTANAGGTQSRGAVFSISPSTSTFTRTFSFIVSPQYFKNLIQGSDGNFYGGTANGNAGFNSVFAFNFNAPPRMRTCDRIKSYGGTANEFFGFTQMNYPTWTLEEWDPARRACLVPEPDRLTPTLLQSAQ